MIKKDDKIEVQALFRLCADLVELTASIEDASAGERKEFQLRKVNLLRRILRQLESPTGLTGFLMDLRDRHALAPRHMMVILLLLASRINDGPDWIHGRSVLRPMSHDTIDLLTTAQLLLDESPLIKNDMLRTQGLITDSVLESQYRIAEWIYDLFSLEVQGIPTEAGDNRARPYLSNAAHLLDMKRLVELYQIQAAGIFDDSVWREYFPEGDNIAGDIAPMIAQTRAAIMSRESRHKSNVNLPVVALREEFSLNEEEETVLLGALFHELFSCPPLLDATELVRLVASDEDDVFKKRRILSTQGRLREGGLLIVEPAIDGKDYMGEVYVAPWVENRLLEGIDEGTAIDARECRTFHRYLKRLRNSDDFYRNL